ncbi:MAG TPA: hypothetical protein VF215_02525 [Thermoanaerobaculia bacterium]
MSRFTAAILVVSATILLAACATRAPEAASIGRQRGMSFAAANPRRGTYGSEASAQSLRKLQELGVDWISLMPFGFHRGDAGLSFGGEHVWETDDSLIATAKQAHALGIRILLKPHVWGRTEQRMESWSEAEWRRWFEDYGRFAEHYATIARDAQMDALCIGNEQKIASTHEAEWRSIIQRVRAIYRGPLTYGANFDEVFEVPFWDALDWIGVSGYFPLTPDASPDRATLVRAWQPIIARLEELSVREKKPVLFTEIGYRSVKGAAWRQWEIPREAAADLDAQRNAYEAFFETVWPRPWVAGAYPWKWFSYPDHGRVDSNDYDLEGKPAEEVIRRAYTSAATSASRSSMRR